MRARSRDPTDEDSTYVDVPPQRGDKAWGVLFGRFALQAIPHPAAVDAKRTIFACGGLEDVLAKASGLIDKTAPGK